MGERKRVKLCPKQRARTTNTTTPLSFLRFLPLFLLSLQKIFYLNPKHKKRVKKKNPDNNFQIQDARKRTPGGGFFYYYYFFRAFFFR